MQFFPLDNDDRLKLSVAKTLTILIAHDALSGEVKLANGQGIKAKMEMINYFKPNPYLINGKYYYPNLRIHEGGLSPDDIVGVFLRRDWEILHLMDAAYAIGKAEGLAQFHPMKETQS